jgi:hypothetical protein
MQNNSPGLLLEELTTIRSRGGKTALMFAGNERHYKDGGRFSLAKWKARIDRFKGVNFTAFIEDGTVIGHYMIDEPNDPANWDGQPVPPSVLEEMARYSKQIWPNLPTIVRVEPDYLADNHQYLDAAWAQYLSRKGAADDFIRSNVAAAQKRGLGLIVGLNVLKGGTPNGTRMTASQLESWGSALLSSTYPCAFISWTYDAGYLSTGGVSGAMDALRRQAQSRSVRTCRGSETSGGETPPPTEPPPSEPPPSEPPPPSTSEGVPFGPYGLPTSEMGSFSGAVRTTSPANVLAMASAARKAGVRVILRLAGRSVANGDGTFSLTKWKAAVDSYGGVNLSSFLGDGTIAGHMLVQNPHDAGSWGGRRIPHATLDEMARYSRQRWPALPTVVQAPPSWLGANPSAWVYLDAAAVIYSGSMGDAGAWIRGQASQATGARLGLLAGMNVLNGGTSASGIPGTTRGKYAMSASQLRAWGSALAAQSQVCGLVLARYEAAYFGRSDVQSAVADVAETARVRAGTSCRTRS